MHQRQRHPTGLSIGTFCANPASNLDCTLCLDCVKACPYDNVALAVRTPGDELFRQSWPHRLDLALLAIFSAFLGTLNAFGMTPPVYDLETKLAALLVTSHEALVLGLIYAVGAIAWPLVLTYSAAWLSKTLVASPLSLNRLVMRYAYSFVPLGFAIWSAHYLFHFLTGFMTIIPAFQTFFEQTLGWALLGPPNWELARRFVPTVDALQITQTSILYVGLLAALALTLNSARKAQPKRGKALLEALPWLILVFLLIFASGAIFLLPMEMRGSALGG